MKLCKVGGVFEIGDVFFLFYLEGCEVDVKVFEKLMFYVKEIDEDYFIVFMV